MARTSNANRDHAVGSAHSKVRGLQLLKAARRVQLTRLMRAINDAPFVKVQEQMRDTDTDQPISSAFLRNLQTVSTADVEDDDEWCFAPIGVVSRMERDVINVAQIEAFARHFGLPLIKWPLPIIDSSANWINDKGLQRDVYADEIGLWGYFVEGVSPVCALCSCVSSKPTHFRLHSVLHSVLVRRRRPYQPDRKHSTRT